MSLIPNERLESAGSKSSEVFSGGNATRTAQDHTVAYDLLIWAIGGKPNTDYMAATFPSSLNKAGGSG